MIYVLYGDDEKAAREKSGSLIGSLREKRPDAEYLRITEEEYTLPAILEYSMRQGLFEKKSIILLDHILQNKEAGESVTPYLQEVADSENIFIFLEGILDAKTVVRMKKFAVKVQEFEKKTGRSTTQPTIFSLADAFGRKDKKMAWILYTQAIARGVAAEEIHAILLWQIKSMILASESIGAKDTGLSPFVFTKSKAYARKYEKKDLEEVSRRFLVAYHDARRGLADIETMLELEILRL